MYQASCPRFPGHVKTTYGRRRRKRPFYQKFILSTFFLTMLTGAVLTGSRFAQSFSAPSVLDSAIPMYDLFDSTEVQPEAPTEDADIIFNEPAEEPEPVQPEEPKATAEPESPEEYDFSSPVPESSPVENSYFDDAVFIGDSRTQGLINNTGLYNAASYVHVGLTVETVFTELLEEHDGVWMSAIDSLNYRNFSKVYLMFGVNEAGWAYSNVFRDDYARIIDAIRAINPEALIYVQGIIPVSEYVSSTHRYIKNPKLESYNQLLREMCGEKQVYYIDTGAAVAGDDGCLPSDAATDGIHLNKKYCQMWLDYLKTHTVLPEQG